MKRVLHLVPHLSTGGCPQFAYDLIRKTLKYTDAYVVEYAFIAPDFVVQRNKVKDLMGDKFFSLSDNKNEIFDLIERIKPDVIHFQEFPEYFMADEIAERIYDKQRSYVIIETSHDSSFNPSQKRFFADHLALISQWQIDKFKSYGIPITLLESDIEKYPKVNRAEGLAKLGLSSHQKHVLNVGLWTSRKNQGEIVEYARQIQDTHPDVMFHFVGNQAGNFQHYWEDYMKDLPKNCKVWGERSDVHNFYCCMDLFLFTSRGLHGDMETSPLVLREATGHSMPILMYNLPVYLNQYLKFDNIDYLDFDDLTGNLNKILKTLNMENNASIFRCEFNKEENKIFIFSNQSNAMNVSIAVRDVDSLHSFYAFDSNFENYSSVWVICLPVEALNRYNKSGYFRGYKVEIYKQDRVNLIEDHTIWYNQNAPHFERVMFESNPWNLTWINYTEMFVEDFYNPLQMEIGGVCLDIGANDGLYTEYLLRNGAERVYAIECDPRSVKFLNKRFNDNEKVVVVNKALHNENKSGVKLAMDGATSTTSSLIDNNHPAHNSHFHNDFYEVETWNYSMLLKKMNIQKVDFFKIDIEGAEYDVFRAMSDEELSEIKGFMVELHWNDGKVYEITDRLEKLGFEIELRRHTVDNAIVPKEDWANYVLCTFYARKTNNNPTEGDAYWKSEDITEVVEVPETKSINVQFHHLRTTLNTDVEKQSLNNIRELADYLRSMFEFNLVILTEYENEPYTDIPPRENCARPNAVSLRAFPNGINEHGQTALTPAHYGCFDSFKKAFLDTNVSKNTEISYHIFFEGDAYVDNFFTFKNSLLDVHRAILKGSEISYVSFGGIYHLETGEILSERSGQIHDIDWGYYSQHVPFAHCVIIPQSYMVWMREAFRNDPWDVTDLFFMNHFRNHPEHKQFVSKSQIARQLNGFSLIDKKVKQYLNK